MISSLELARLCGVSQGTVDRALHGRTGISKTTRDLVLKIAAEHGYKPNPNVRAMLRGESEVVGALIPQSGSVFFADMLEAMRVATDHRGLRLYATFASNDDNFLEALEDMAARRMRGAVVVPPSEHVALPDYLQFSIASVLSPIQAKNTVLIAPDEVETGRRATEYLLGKGHRKIWHLTYPREMRAINQRRQGYEQTMRGRGLEPRSIGDLAPESLVDALRAELPTALFCHNDWLALKTMRAMEGAGLRVPEDVSVIGVDDAPTFRELSRGLTTLAYPMSSVAAAAAKWLVEGGTPDPIPAPEVVERRTVRVLSSTP